MRGLSYTSRNRAVAKNETIQHMEDKLEEASTLREYYIQGLKMIKDLNEGSYYILWLKDYNPGPHRGNDFELLVQCKTLGRDRSLFSILTSTRPLRATSTRWGVKENDNISLTWDITLWGIQNRPDIPRDLPLYISWPHKTRLFEKLLKKGIPDGCPNVPQKEESEINPG